MLPTQLSGRKTIKVALPDLLKGLKGGEIEMQETGQEYGCQIRCLKPHPVEHFDFLWKQGTEVFSIDVRDWEGRPPRDILRDIVGSAWTYAIGFGYLDEELHAACVIARRDPISDKCGTVAIVIVDIDELYDAKNHGGIAHGDNA